MPRKSLLNFYIKFHNMISYRMPVSPFFFYCFAVIRYRAIVHKNIFSLASFLLEQNKSWEGAMAKDKKCRHFLGGGGFTLFPKSSKLQVLSWEIYWRKMATKYIKILNILTLFKIINNFKKSIDCNGFYCNSLTYMFDL